MSESITPTKDLIQGNHQTLQGQLTVLRWYRPEGTAPVLTGILKDESGSCYLRFDPKKSLPLSELRLWDTLTVSGVVFHDDGEDVLYLDVVTIDDDRHQAPLIDDAPVKRVELNVHSVNSQINCFSRFEDYALASKDYGITALAITDVGSVQSYHDAYRLQKTLGLKVIYGLETEFIDEERGIIVPIVVYARNTKGLAYIYQLVTMQKTHIAFGKDGSIINRDLLNRMKDGLILASSPTNSDLTTYFSNDLTDDKILNRMAFYDVIELSPLDNYRQFILGSLVNDHVPAERKYEDFIRLALSIKKPLVVVSDAHYVSLAQKEYATVFDFGGESPAYTFRSTRKLFEELSFISDRALLENIILRAPQALADRIPQLFPFDEVRHEPTDKGAMDAITDKALENSKALYGDPLPGGIRERIDAELDFFEEKKLAPELHFASQIAEKYRKNGNYLALNGPLSLSFVCYLLSLTDVNPLSPHRYCPFCQVLYPIEDCTDSIMAEDRDCPGCGSRTLRDGIRTHSELLFATDHPMVDISVPVCFDDDVMDDLKTMAGKAGNNAYKASHIIRIQEAEARERVYQYAAHIKAPVPSKSEVERLTQGILPLRDENGEYYSDVMLVPKTIEMTKHFAMEYTPETHFPWMMTQNDYDDMKDNYDIFRVRSSYSLMDLRKLNDLCHKTPRELEEGVSKTLDRSLALLTGVEALGLANDARKRQDGLLGLPYLNRQSLHALIAASRPTGFEHLITLMALSEKSDAQILRLVRDTDAGLITLDQVIFTKDDLYDTLIRDRTIGRL